MEERTTQPQEQQESLRLKVLSDIHLEAFRVGGLSRFKEILEEKFHLPQGKVEAEGANAVALLGDICYPSLPTFAELLAELKQTFPLVFFVAGNHEFFSYGRTTQTYEDILKEMQQICEQHDVIFLHRSSVQVHGLRVLGCTLWSHIPEGSSREHISKSISDYSRIYFATDSDRLRKATIDDTNKIHSEDVAWLRSEIEAAKGRNEKVVVMTHYAPTFRNTSAPAHRDSPVKEAFATDLTHLFADPVVAWFYGHTHFTSVQRINEVLIGSNQLGYFNEAGGTGFNPHVVFTITSQGQTSVNGTTAIITKS